MHIQLLSIGQKMPDWADSACRDFIRRMPPELKLTLNLLPLGKRGKNPDVQRIKRDEGQLILKAARYTGCGLLKLIGKQRNAAPLRSAPGFRGGLQF